MTNEKNYPYIAPGTEFPIDAAGGQTIDELARRIVAPYHSILCRVDSGAVDNAKAALIACYQEGYVAGSNDTTLNDKAAKG